MGKTKDQGDYFVKEITRMFKKRAVVIGILVIFAVFTIGIMRARQSTNLEEEFAAIENNESEQAKKRIEEKEEQIQKEDTTENKKEISFVDRVEQICEEDDLEYFGAAVLHYGETLENFLFCGNKATKQYALYVLDGQGSILWQDTFTGSYNGPSLPDIDSNRKSELYWAFQQCTDSCTKCTTIFNVFNGYQKEKFTITDESTSESGCNNLMRSSRSFSPNLLQEQYKVFREYLEEVFFYRG